MRFHTASVPPDRNTGDEGLPISPANVTYTSECNGTRNTVSLIPRHTHVAANEPHRFTYKYAIRLRHMALSAAPRIGHRLMGKVCLQLAPYAQRGVV